MCQLDTHSALLCTAQRLPQVSEWKTLKYTDWRTYMLSHAREAVSPRSASTVADEPYLAPSDSDTPRRLLVLWTVDLDCAFQPLSHQQALSLVPGFHHNMPYIVFFQQGKCTQLLAVCLACVLCKGPIANHAESVQIVSPIESEVRLAVRQLTRRWFCPDDIPLHNRTSSELCLVPTAAAIRSAALTAHS